MNPLRNSLYFKGDPGKLYRPSNGEEGIYFEEAFCENCMKEDPESESWCHIHTNVLIGERAPEWIHDKDGIPCCTEWVQREKDV